MTDDFANKGDIIPDTNVFNASAFEEDVLSGVIVKEIGNCRQIEFFELAGFGIGNACKSG